MLRNSHFSNKSVKFSFTWMYWYFKQESRVFFSTKEKYQLFSILKINVNTIKQKCGPIRKIFIKTITIKIINRGKWQGTAILLSWWGEDYYAYTCWCSSVCIKRQMFWHQITTFSSLSHSRWSKPTLLPSWCWSAPMQLLLVSSLYWQTPTPGQIWDLTLLLCGKKKKKNNNNKNPHQILPEGAVLGFWNFACGPQLPNK